jgi:hypothetical protein
MNTLRKSILIGFTVLGMAAAHAQEAQPAASQHGASQQGADAGQDGRYVRQAPGRLHDLLKLTAQQESAWATYQAAIKPAA